MQLDFKTVQSISRGVSYLSVEQKGIQFHRFNKLEEEYYAATEPPLLQVFPMIYL